jgi:hypothetical protein
MPYTAQKPANAESSDQLRARIPGWGVDLDPADRPSDPKMRPDPLGEHGELPERQPERWPRERSIEHARLTPVFGTSCPPKGASGVLRKLSYRRYSEARLAHWLLLILADRVDVVESASRSLLTLRPDNPVTQTGVLSELTHHPIASRFGQKRADLTHLWVDPVVVAGPWVAAGGAAYAVARSLARRRHSA